MHNCSNITWTLESKQEHLHFIKIAMSGGKHQKESGRTHLTANVRAGLH